MLFTATREVDSDSEEHQNDDEHGDCGKCFHHLEISNFSNSTSDFAMENQDANCNQNDSEQANNDNTNLLFPGRGDNPTDEAYIGYDHDALPKFQIGDLFLEAIEFRHFTDQNGTYIQC